MNITITVNTGIVNKSIHECSVEELKVVQDELNLAWRTSQQRKALEFSIGDAVSFNHKKGLIEGEVVKINQKSVSIKTTTGVRWNVSPGLLTKLEQV